MSDALMQLFDDGRSDAQWYELLGTITHAEYIEFVGYVFDQLNELQPSHLVEWRHLILAFARKEYETAKFVHGLTDEQRASCLNASEAYFQLAKTLYPASSYAALDAARQAELDHGEKFGWPSPVFEVLDKAAVFAVDI